MDTQVLQAPQRQLIAQALNDQQQRLLAQLQALLGGADRVSHAHEQLEQDSDGGRAGAVEREVDTARGEQLRQELTEVESALLRLTAPGFGLCSDCGEAIALQRLLHSPATLRCLSCQTRHERMHAGHAHASL